VSRTPASTYRLQVTEDFDLLEAARTLPYLHRLGVDWVYLSPLLTAEAGSDHGYDVADHRTVDATRGGGAGLAALSAEARRLGMGVLVDVVPNHVGVAQPWLNDWWWHVLTHGEGSPYASAFDVDWAAGGGRLLVPVVGDDDLVEDDGRTLVEHLRVEGGELRYHDQRFPLAPGSVRGPDDDPQTVHARQHYELVHWRRADAELNYRRFFAINTLAAVRVEDPQWFERSHVEVRRWFDEGLVDGLRIDHPDGLRAPGRYLDDLADLTGGAYVLVEKILEPGEQLPASWATAGTTGYDAMALVDRVLVDPAGQAPLDALEARLRGGDVDWHEMIHGTKRQVADGILHAEVRRISREVAHVLAGAADGPTTPPDRVEDAVAELLACFPVYRSYLPEGREHLEQALAEARRRRPDLGDVLDVLAPVLADGASDPAQRFQQTSGMVMAKGVEDCAFYRWSRLTSLNEVGGDPSVFAVDLGRFHDEMVVRQRDRPRAMTAATTHDTKRSEDTRARISALAEVPERWEESLARLLDLVPLPDLGFGNLLWQAVVGTWPADPDDTWRDRLHAYAEKAMREAGDRTTWTAQDADYEAAVHRAVDAVLDDPEVRAVVDDLAGRVADAGWANALAAKLVGLTMPGVPDVYQGTELWDHSLVDPDNRRPVDFVACADLLARLRQGERPAAPRGLGAGGEAKLLLTHVALTARRDHPEWFTGYTPVTATGPAADHVLAFDRGGAVTVATRLPIGLERAGGWRDTALPLPPGRYVDLVGGRPVRVGADGAVAVAALLGDLPVALLVPDTTGDRGRFDVWAPTPESLDLVVGDRTVPMERGADDWWSPTGPEPLGEVDHGYRVDGSGTVVPGPRSRRLPHGVHGPARTVDPAAYRWHDDAWTGRQLAGSVIYEMHVGTFTPEGTLDAAIGRLDHLRDLGVDLVEVMPVNAFNGEHGWGYDGVAWFAVHEAYGGPAGYQRFVDACHRAGIGVVQDVVHNHLGPSGNYLPLFGPYLSSEGRNTWGDHLDLAEPEVRRYVLDNVRMWFEDYHVDALRLDAVHALEDTSEVHVLEEMAVLTARLSSQQGRPLTLIAESDLNDPTLIRPREAGGHGLDAQWSDDFHHAVHVALTGETSGYYADFEPLGALAKVCERGFFHDGTWSSFRGREHGAPIDVATMPAWRLVVCSQNHDQVGNRARGDRLSDPAPGHLDDDQLACAALLTLTGPFTPMLFQGEEWAASTPFAFFSSHPEHDLGEAVSKGRVEEFARMDWDVSTVPDPQDPATYRASRLDWAERHHGRHAVLLEVHRSLARLRRTLPDLTDPDLRRTSCQVDEDARWFVMRRGEVVVVVNFADRSATVPLGGEHGEHVVHWATPAGATAVPGGVELPAHAGAVLLPLE